MSLGELTVQQIRMLEEIYCNSLFGWWLIFCVLYWFYGQDRISTCFYIYFSVSHFKWWRFESIHCSGWCETTPLKLLQTQELLKKMSWFINRFFFVRCHRLYWNYVHWTESQLVFHQMKSVWNQLHRMMSTLENIQTSGWTCCSAKTGDEVRKSKSNLLCVIFVQ